MANLTSVVKTTGREDTQLTYSYALLKTLANETSDVTAFKITSLGSGTLTFGNGQYVLSQQGNQLYYSFDGGDPVAITGLFYSGAGISIYDASHAVNPLNVAGSLKWQPAANANGVLTAFSVVGATGVSPTATFTPAPVAVEVNVAAVNDPVSVSGPVVLASAAEDSGAIIITNAQLVANASDPDGQTLTATNVTSNAGQLVNNGNGTWTLTPAENYHGTITLNYSVTDGNGSTVATSATKVITSVNDAPLWMEWVEGNWQAITDDFSEEVTARPGQLVPGVNGILVSDMIENMYSDADGDTIGIQITAVPGPGVSEYSTDDGQNWQELTVGTQLHATDRVRYTAPNIQGEDMGSFSFKLWDGQTTSTYTETVNFVNRNNAPSVDGIASLGAPVAEDSGAIVITQADLIANATDADGDSLSAANVTVQGGNEVATITDNGNGTWTLTPAENYNGTITLNYTIQDGNGGQVSATATKVVTPVNDQPVLNGAAEHAMNNINEDVGANAGTTVAQLVSNGSITDVDGTAVEAIAITGLGQSGPIQVTTNGAADTNADVAADASGNLHMVYERDGNVYYQEYNALAGNWSAAQIVGAGMGASVAVDGNGVAHVAYVSDGQAVYANSVDGFTSSAFVGESVSQVDIAVEANGKAHLVYTGRDGGSPYGYPLYATNGGDTSDFYEFAPSVALDSSGGGGGSYHYSGWPTIQVDSNGAYHIVENFFNSDSFLGAPDPAGYAYFTNADGGVNSSHVIYGRQDWGNNGSMGSMFQNTDGHLQIAPDGTPYFLYTNHWYNTTSGGTPTGTDGLILVNLATGWNETVITGVSATDKTLYIDPVTGDMTISYVSGGQVFVVTSDDDGANWSEPTVIETTGTSPFAPVITANGNVIYIASDGDNEIYHTSLNQMPSPGTWEYSTNGGQSWTAINAAELSETNALLLAPTDLVRFIPAENYNGEQSFTFKAWDMTSGTHGTYANTTQGTAFSSATGEATITVNPVNDAPTGLAISANTVAEGAAENTVIGTLSASDLEGQAITYSLPDAADAEIFKIVGNQLMVKDGAQLDYENQHSISVLVRATDAGGAYTEETVTINITNTNDTAPVLNDGSATINENSAAATLVTTLSATDADNLGGLTYTKTGNGTGAALFNVAANGAITVANGADLNYEAASSYTLEVQVSDGVRSDTATITINLNNLNDTAPVFTSNAEVEAAENGTAVTTVTATDADNLGALTYSIVGGADQNKFSINAQTGVLTFNTAPNYEAPTDNGANNVYDVQVQVSDGLNTTTQDIAVTVTNVNEAPSIIAHELLNTIEYATTTILPAALAATDPEGNALTYTVTDLPDLGLLYKGDVPMTVGSTFTAADIANGVIKYANDEGRGTVNLTGTDSFGFTVNDGQGGSTAGVFNININRDNAAPILDLNGILTAGTNGAPVAYTENANAVNLTPVVSLTDADTNNFNGGYVLVSIDTNAEAGDVLSVINNGSGGLITVSGDAVSYQGTVIGHIDGIQNGQGTALKINLDADAPNVTAVRHLIQSIQYATNETAGVAKEVSYIVNDGEGDVAKTSATTTLTLTTTAINDTPVNTVPGAQNVNEDATLTFTNSISVADNDNASLTVTVSVTNGVLSLNGTAGLGFTAGDGANDTTMTFSGTKAAINTALNGLVYTPTANYSGVAQLTLTTTDGTLTNTDTVAITVAAQNDAPTGIDSTVTATEDTTYVFTIDDFDYSDVENDDLSYVRIDSLPVNGTLKYDGIAIEMPQEGGFLVSTADIEAGKLTFVPAENANGDAYASFTFSVKDNNSTTAANGEQFDVAPNTLTIHVTPVNDEPVGVNDTVAVDEDAVTLNIQADLLANDTDVEDDSLDITAVDTIGTVGTVSFNNNTNTLTYAADKNVQNALAEGETVIDTFTYTVSDGNGGTSTATVTVTVTGVNDGPVAADDTNEVAANAISTISGNVKTNDTDVDNNAVLTVDTVNGDAGKVGQDVPGTYGTFHILAGGTYTYDVDQANVALIALKQGQSVTDTITYTVVDEHGASDTATLAVTINGVNEAPVNHVPTQELYMDNGGNSTLIFNDLFGNGGTISITDPDSADAMTVTLTPAHGVLSIDPADYDAQITGFGSDVSPMVITGTQEQINEVLADMVFVPNLGYHGSATITMVSDDGLAQNTSTINILIGSASDEYRFVANTGDIYVNGVDVNANGTTIYNFLTENDDDYDTLAIANASAKDAVVQQENGNTTFLFTNDEDPDYSVTLHHLTMSLDGTRVTFEDGSLLKLNMGGASTLVGGSLNDQLIAGDSGDTLRGLAGGDKLVGGDGADVIYGGSGADIIDGGAGNDIINGGIGNDLISGGLGADLFTYSGRTNGINGGTDTITDFNFAAGDRIQLTGLAAQNIGSLTEEDFFANVLAVFDDGHGHAQIMTNSSDIIILEGVAVAEVTAAYFVDYARNQFQIIPIEG